jgi:hypothetical protein
MSINSFPDRHFCRPPSHPREQGYPDQVEQDKEEPEVEEDASHPAGTNTALPPKIEAWRKRSATGAILTGFALGLQEALQKPKEEPSIMMETSGDPPKDLPVEADFEYGRPKHSVVHIRPWLLPERAAGDEATQSEDGAADELE